MAILYAYFDESGKKGDHRVVAFAGMCATEKRIEIFDEEWQGLLRTYGWKTLHMKELMRRRKFSHRIDANTPRERADALKPFADCINEHLQFGMVMAMDVNGFNNLPKGTRAGLGNPKDPNYVAFARGMMEIVKFCKADDRIAIVCDHDNETAPGFWSHYQGIRRAYEPLRNLTVSISFADDDYFPSLQAADMVAYLARLEAKRQWFGERHDYKELINHMVDKRAPGMAMQWGIVFADEHTLRSTKSNADILAERERLTSASVHASSDKD